MSPHDLPDPLRRHVALLQALRDAERDYHVVTRTETPVAGGRTGRASQRRIDEALERLADCVVALQDVMADHQPSAEPLRSGEQEAPVMPAALWLAGQKYAGYLAARTYDEVRAEARRRMSVDP